MYTKYMGVLVPSIGGAPDWAKAETLYQDMRGWNQHTYNATATQSGWLSIEYTTGSVTSVENKLTIDGNTVFLDRRLATTNTYEAYFEYLIPIADRSVWALSLYGRHVVVKFIPPRIERKI